MVANFIEKRGSHTYIRYSVPRGLSASCKIKQLRCKLPAAVGVKEAKLIARQVVGRITGSLRDAKRAGIVFSNVDIKRAMTAYAEELAQSHIDFHMHFPVSGASMIELRPYRSLPTSEKLCGALSIRRLRCWLFAK